MSAAAVNTYRGKIERGTCTLAQIDQAERGKLVTAAEANTLRAYYRSVYDVTGVAAEAVTGRAQIVMWTGPSSNVGPLVEVRRVNPERTVSVYPADRRAVFAGDVGDDETVVGFEVTVVAANGYRGVTVSTSCTVPAVPPPPPPVEPEPEPEPEPVPVEPEPAPVDPAPADPTDGGTGTGSSPSGDQGVEQGGGTGTTTP